jgi:hypothetical protein
VATGVHACGHAHTYMLWTVSKIYSKLSDERDFKCHLMKYAFKETFTYVRTRGKSDLCIYGRSVTSPPALSWFSHLTISSLLVQSPHHQLSPGSVTSPSALSWFSHLTISSLLVQSPHHQLSPGSVTSPSALSWAHMWYSYHDSEIVYCKPHPHTMDCRCARVPRPGSLLSLPSLALWSVIALRKWKLKRLMKLYIGHPQTD